jgi:hypothetical protein
MEALQLFKFSLKKEHLNFMHRWSTSEVAMLGVSQPTQDLLGSLFINNSDNVNDSDNVVDDILHTIGSYNCD